MKVIYLPTRSPVDSSPMICRSAKSTDRGAQWRAFIADRHRKSEIAIERQLRRYLQESREGYRQRLELIIGGKKAVSRALSEMQWANLLATALSKSRLIKATRSTLEKIMRSSFRWGSEQVGLPDLSWAPELSPLDQQIDELQSRVVSTQEKRVVDIVTAGLASGSSVSDMQSEISRDPAFGLARSLTIARTETTRAISSGSYHAFQNAAAHGVIVRQQWLSARDSAVRDSHTALDMEEVSVPLGGQFQVPGTSHKARYPGDFGIASEDINCRCTVIPIVD